MAVTAPRDVLILLSTYNGARFLEEQVASIRAQTYADWHLLVRDDGSTDDTRKLLRGFAAADPRVEIFTDGLGNLGAWRSFGALVNAAATKNPRYVFFADQDDVWQRHKVGRELNELQKLEALTPLAAALVSSDLQVVDERLTPLYESFREHQHMYFDHDDPLGTFLVHNSVVGCTLAFNGQLLSLAAPIPAGVPHDWWVALCAASAGRVMTIDEPLVRYRQHGTNVVGASHKRAFLRALVYHPLASAARVFGALGESAQIAHLLAQRLAERGVGGEVQRRLTSYAAAYTGPTVKRINALRHSGARPTRRLSRILFPALVAAYPIVVRHSRFDSDSVFARSRKADR